MFKVKIYGYGLMLMLLILWFKANFNRKISYLIFKATFHGYSYIYFSM